MRTLTQTPQVQTPQARKRRAASARTAASYHAVYEANAPRREAYREALLTTFTVLTQAGMTVEGIFEALDEGEDLFGVRCLSEEEYRLFSAALQPSASLPGETPDQRELVWKLGRACGDLRSSYADAEAIAAWKREKGYAVCPCCQERFTRADTLRTG